MALPQLAPAQEVLGAALQCVKFDEHVCGGQLENWRGGICSFTDSASFIASRYTGGENIMAASA
jgi:hypothetical protein